jgi:protease-4
MTPSCSARILVLALFCLLAAGCSTSFSLIGGGGPGGLTEQTVRGAGADRVALVHLKGVISTDPRQGLLGDAPSVVQEVSARLDKAAADERVRAVVLAIDSPGGSTAASDILNHEIRRFRDASGRPVVALLMGLATSGGYYAAAACDAVVAHPATITGSIGTIFVRPKVDGLMDTIGVDVVVSKSGRHKDMGSPFREASEDERALFQAIIDEHNQRFLEAVMQGRGLSREELAPVDDARLLTAEQAVNAGLADAVGYLDDAVAQAESRAGLAPGARLVVYRRGAAIPDSTAYTTMRAGPGAPALLDTGLSRWLAVPRTGFYHLWAPEYGVP